jgi:acyl-CoA thioester hydrolase
MGDTDAAGIIYFGAPLRWAERLATTWFFSAGVPLSSMFAAGEGLPAVHAELSYKRPLRLDDEIEGTLWLANRTDRSVTLRTEFALVGTAGVAVEVQITQVHVSIGNGEIRSTPMPGSLAAALEG